MRLAPLRMSGPSRSHPLAELPHRYLTTRDSYVALITDRLAACVAMPGL